MFVERKVRVSRTGELPIRHRNFLKLQEQRSSIQDPVPNIRGQHADVKSVGPASQMRRSPQNAGNDYPAKEGRGDFQSAARILRLLLLTLASCLLVAKLPEAVGAQQVPPAEAPNEPNDDNLASSTSNSATCFGGLQTFEKISMSSFESPAGSGSAGSSFGSGILVQQDDQALTSECVNLCRSQANCLSFVIDYNKFECKSYATTQQELQQEMDAKYQASAGRSLGNSSAGEPSSGNFSAASSVSFQHLLPSASSNYFEKICFEGVANRNQFSDVCGQGRLWTVERVVDSFLDGFVEKEVTNVNNKDECSKLCIFESQFVCRSADFDQQSRLCRLSKEDRRTQPQAMRYLANSNRQYIENQCATPGPSSCVYETKRNQGIISMDALKFAQTLQDCQMKCNQESTFNCRSYSFHQQRCFLSGDDSFSLNSNLVKLPVKQGWQFGEKKCLVELCTKGIFSYEKITGYTLRSALSTPIDLMMAGSAPAFMLMASGAPEEAFEEARVRQKGYFAGQPQTAARNSSAAADLVSSMMAAAANSAAELLEAAASAPSKQKRRSANNLAITNHCRHSCDLGYLNCPAFTIDYKNNRCQRLDRNSQGRHNELVARAGFSYYEKICLRVPEIMSMCQDKYWIFERVIGFELAPRFYDKSLKFVQSRRDCEEYCLEERQFQCRSALYNDETSDCKLSRYDRRLASLDGGYYKNFNARVSYLENQCIRDHRTLGQAPTGERGPQEAIMQERPRQLECKYEQARNEPSYPSFTEHIEMVPMTPERELEGNRSSGNLQGSAYCEQLCNDNSKFECRSFGYYASTAQCFLSGDDSVSAGEMATTPSTGFVYFEKKCRPGNETSVEPEVAPPPTKQPTRPPEPNSEQLPPANQNPYFQPPSHSSSANTSTADQAGYSPLEPGKQFPASAVEHKCGPEHSFVYQRTSGFEPVGGYLTLLVKNNQQPGIVAECAELCRKAFECRAFVVDYNNNQCFAMLENSSVGTLSLRQTLGKDYFEGFCLPSHLLAWPPDQASCRHKSWLVDKIVDQAVVGVQAQRLIFELDRVQCRQACLEERLFYCKSAMFDAAAGSCKLYSVERESMPHMRLLFTKGVDFFENQCQISSSSCPYDPIERDLSMVSVAKSAQARSSLDCEHACNQESAFNCRSYTYLEQNPSLPNLCLLSSDSRSTSQKGSIRERPRALYAERNCYYRRPRFPAPAAGSHHQPEVPPEPVFEQARPFAPDDPYRAPTSGGHRSPTSQPSLQPGYDQPPRATPEPSKISDLGPPLGGQACEPHQFSFERTFGYDYRLAAKERAPIPPGVGVAIACQQECLRRGDRCKSFVLDYGLPYQSCFLIDSQVGANKRLLVRALDSAYFEKVCLPRGAVSFEASVVDQTGSPALPSSEQPLDNSMDIAPSYTNEPWAPQQIAQHAGSSLPYYMQRQQQLVPSYASKSCAKLWTFERFLNHNLTIESDKQFENVLVRAHCEALCLNEASFNCRSATYDYGSKLCRLFRHTRRTMMSQFTDLSKPSSSPAGGKPPSAEEVLSVGTAQVINSAELDSLQTASNNQRASTPGRQVGAGRQLSPGQQELDESTANIDYLENSCSPEPSSCQYRQLYDLFNPYIDKVNHAVSLSDCQRQCDLEKLFGCKSLNYDPSTRNCMLINEDLISLDRGAAASGGLVPRKNNIYSEKGNCEMISVQCNAQEMLVTVNFDSAFRGRLMAKGNPEQCYLVGDGQTSLQFPILFGPKCNTRQEGHNTFVNELVIQQHPVIMTDNDKTVRVMCAFEAPEQTISLRNPSSRDNKTTGIDVGAPEMSRTRQDKQQFNSVVSSKAPPPSVLLRILDQNGRDASMINLGDELLLKIQLQSDPSGQESGSALGIFARNLAAKSSNGESLLLIDNEGCPVDHQVFPGLELDPKDGKSLLSSFKAFRFPSSGLVNFEVQIRFCPERCQPVSCSLKHSPAGQASARAKSYGRRRRKRQARTSVLESVNTEGADLRLSTRSGGSPLDSLSTVMKPGKAFQYVRELMLNKKPPEEQQPSQPPEGAADDASSEPAPEEEASTEPPRPGPDQPADTQLDSNGTGGEPAAEVNQDFESKSQEGQKSREQSGAAENLNQALQSPAILMHVDDRVLGEPSLEVSKPLNSHSVGAPYGRFPALDANGLAGSRHQAAPSGNSLELIPTTQMLDLAPQDSPTKPVNELPASQTSSKEMPLKFSIMVAENQLSGNSNWTPGGFMPSVINSSKVDMDHIVVPGRDGQFPDEDSSPTTTTTTSSVNNLADHKMLRPKNSLYEQTFDALPSNSVVAEVKLHSTRNVASSLEDLPGRLGPQNNEIASEQMIAGNHLDCASRLSTIIWTGAIVICLNVCLVLLSLFLYFRRVQWWCRNSSSSMRTGASECGTHSSLGGGGSGARWPSVLLKSKSNLSTSLNTHEHFFCKLNSKQSSPNALQASSNSNSNSNKLTEFNWPNLSASSTHSTISSLAAPDHLQASSTSIVRINQTAAHQRQLYKPKFTDSSSIRNGKFNASMYETEPDNNFNSVKSNKLALDAYESSQQDQSTSSLSRSIYTRDLHARQIADTFDSMR